jgi:uncharacterized protein YgiM (DUF1202 family)
MRVNAPVGAIVAALPFGAVSLMIGGRTHYRCSGVYYRPVSSGYLVVDPPVAFPGPSEPELLYDTVAVTAWRLNVREAPGLSRAVIAQVSRGTRLAVVGSAQGWLYVELPGGDLGWVMERYTRPLMSAADG